MENSLSKGPLSSEFSKQRLWLYVESRAIQVAILEIKSR